MVTLGFRFLWALTGVVSILFAIYPRPSLAQPYDYDAIVVGAGIAGLSTALELGRGGARVLVVEMNSVGGGHAVMAGGFAFVDTPLQRAKGIQDSPELAYRDWMAWGETNDPVWTRRYAESATPMVHNWLGDLGVQFKVLIPSPENSVHRFHFTQGKAIHAVLPILQEALRHDNISFLWNTEVTALRAGETDVIGVRTRNLRTDVVSQFDATYVVLATGGFQNNLSMVQNMSGSQLKSVPDVLKGASPFAQGLGFNMAKTVEAGASRLNTFVTFLNGVPNPRDPSRALVASNPNWLWVNSNGKRFANEQGSDKDALPEILTQEGAAYWAIFDVEGVKTLRLRDALWLTQDRVQKEVLDNSDIVVKADRVSKLAAAIDMPAGALGQTIALYNGAIQQGIDPEFARFDQSSRRKPNMVVNPPFYGLRLHLVTRKNLGGLAVDDHLRVLDKKGDVISHLYAVGEATGVVGINGDHGMSGTFLGPSVFTGRLAGQAILDELRRQTASWVPAPTKAPVQTEVPPERWAAPLGSDDLHDLLKMEREGYWHFDQAHKLVLERDQVCAQCHSATHPMQELIKSKDKLSQALVCTQCH